MDSVRVETQQKSSKNEVKHVSECLILFICQNYATQNEEDKELQADLQVLVEKINVSINVV